jgi:hypothetical protein
MTRAASSVTLLGGQTIVDLGRLTAEAGEILIIHPNRF